MTAKEAHDQLLKKHDADTILRCLREMEEHMKKTAVSPAAPQTTLEK